MKALAATLVQDDACDDEEATRVLFTLLRLAPDPTAK